MVGGQGLRRVLRHPQPLRERSGGIDQLCELIDEHGESLTADLDQFHGIRVDDVWAGRVSARHVLTLAGQLLRNPQSRFRADRLGDDRWIGWTLESSALAGIHDVLLGIGYALAQKQMPADAFFKRPTTPFVEQAEPNLFAPTIAEFNIGSFMRQIHS
ncbi:hypothetical protein ACFWGP_05345 [Agromyces sp. NPDC127015]|uniref:hypothetical protein n=1 Tax=Agromyces sp. NPDC127015 TaxID=3347108 RepID=UPI00364DEE10